MTKPRSILKDYFTKGKIPRESDFADLIDSMVNQEDDKLTIESGTGKAVFKGSLKVESTESSSFAGNLNLGAGTNITFADNGSIRSFNEAHSIIFHRTEAGKDVNKLELREWGSIVFSSGATEREETAKMVIRDNGNVGIGTKEPKAKFHVEGDTEINGNLNLSAGKIIKFADNGSIESLDSHHQIIFRRMDNKLELREHGDIVFSSGAKSGDETAKMVILASGNVGIGTKEPKEKLDVNGNVQASGKLKENGHDLVPKGAIIMWSGSQTEIPGGWALCDGTNGTPDLRGRFIVGVCKDYPVNTTGGKDQVTLTVDQMPSHNHSNGDYKHLSRISDGIQEATGKGFDKTQGEPDIRYSCEMKNSGGGQPHENRPPYYALCFIMKL